LKLYRLRTLQEWHEHCQLMNQEYGTRENYERGLELHLVSTTKDWRIRGFSYTAQQIVDFHIQKNVIPINWRETVLCPITKLSNRVRASLHIFDSECSPYSCDPLFITEQTTPTYMYLFNNFKNVIGSEFLGEAHFPGKIMDGIRHENIVQLSFSNETLKHILCFDVFEHVPEYMAGFKECYRVLSAGGSLVWTVPFSLNSDTNQVRASIDEEGDTIHLTEPEFHTDQFNSQDILCFYHFGWELLQQVRQIGFRDVYAVLYWSDIFGYLGREGVVFIAIK